MPEFPKEIMKAARYEIKKYCMENNIIHDIDYGQDYLQQKPELNLRLVSNKRSFNNKHFVNEKLLAHYAIFEENPKAEGFEYYFEEYLRDNSKEIDYFKDCIFKRSDYSITAGKSNFRWEHDRFDIYEFLKGLWNNKKLTPFDHISDEKDENGNLIYCKDREDLITL